MNLRSSELGVYICGGRGRSSRQTPAELLDVAERTGLDGEALVRCSRLSAKVDNTAVQDGFQLYLHSFVVTAEGDWAVIQQDESCRSDGPAVSLALFFAGVVYTGTACVRLRA